MFLPLLTAKALDHTTIFLKRKGGSGSSPCLKTEESAANVMKYVPLRKYYYGDEKVYSEIYQNRYKSAESIKFDFLIAQKPAFFTQSEEVIACVYQILRYDKQVQSLIRDLPGKAAEQYSKKCLIDEIVLSNKIEGVYSSRKEIGDVLDELEDKSNARGKKKRFNGIVNKYLKLLGGEEVPLKTCQDIRTLYDELVLDEVVAEDRDNMPDGKIFRKEMSEIKSATGKVIHRGIYPERAMISEMKKALAFLHDDAIEPLYRICIFHYLLEYIHPFYDGNGRLGRFIVSYYISTYLENLLAFRLSETILRNINAYYDAFEICNDPRNLGDVTPFLIMMLQMILKSIKELKESLERKKFDWTRYQKLLRNCPNLEKKNVEKTYNVLLQAALFSENGISTKELQAVFDLSYGSVRNLLLNIPHNILLSSTHGREKHYMLDLRAIDAVSLPGD